MTVMKCYRVVLPDGDGGSIKAMSAIYNDFEKRTYWCGGWLCLERFPRPLGVCLPVLLSSSPPSSFNFLLLPFLDAVRDIFCPFSRGESCRSSKSSLRNCPEVEKGTPCIPALSGLGTPIAPDPPPRPEKILPNSFLIAGRFPGALTSLCAPCTA